MSLAAYPAMMRRDRQHLGLRECRAAWLLGITVRDYRQLEAGEDDLLVAQVCERMVEVFGLAAKGPREGLASLEIHPLACQRGALVDTDASHERVGILERGNQ